MGTGVQAEVYVATPPSVPRSGWARCIARTYSVILHCAMPVAGSIEEHVTCFFVELESQGRLL